MPGALDHSPADIVRRLLIRDGHGVDPTGAAANAWPVYAHGDPAQPRTTRITVFETAGYVGGRDSPTSERYEQQGVQVKVSGSAHDSARAKADDIAQWMDRSVYLEVVTVGSNTYTLHAIHRTSGVLALGKDSAAVGVWSFTVNAVVTVRQRI